LPQPDFTVELEELFSLLMYQKEEFSLAIFSVWHLKRPHRDLKEPLTIKKE
jgi:hypothetical protein